jgi:hypothetical protein
VYGAITFYLAHKDAVEMYLKDQERRWKELKTMLPPLPKTLSEKLRRAKEERSARQA